MNYTLAVKVDLIKTEKKNVDRTLNKYWKRSESEY